MFQRRRMKHHWYQWISISLEQQIKKTQKIALTIGLMMVDEATKFVHVIPMPTKEATAYVVEDVCKVLILSNSKIN